MNFYEVFVRSPVNRQAAGMLSSSKQIEADIGRDELIYLIQRLERKRRLLSKAIGVTTGAQRRNLMWKINKGKKTYRSSLHPRGVEEWRRNGLAINRLKLELARRNKLQLLKDKVNNKG